MFAATCHSQAFQILPHVIASAFPASDILLSLSHDIKLPSVPYTSRAMVYRLPWSKPDVSLMPAMGAHFRALSHPLPFVTPLPRPFAMFSGSSTTAARKYAVGCWMTTRRFAPTAAPFVLPTMRSTALVVALAFFTMPFCTSRIRFRQ